MSNPDNKDNKNLPVRKTMCPTCPFRRGSPTEFLRPELELSARTEASRICHSTGEDNAFHKSTGLPDHICRGARDIQLEQFCQMNVIAEPSDEAWNAAREAFGMPPQVVKDPGKGKFVKWEGPEI